MAKSLTKILLIGLTGIALTFGSGCSKEEKAKQIILRDGREKIRYSEEELRKNMNALETYMSEQTDYIRKQIDSLKQSSYENKKMVYNLNKAIKALELEVLRSSSKRARTERRPEIDEYDVEKTGKIIDICLPKSFTCTGNEDTNGDGGISKDEIANFGSYFECREKGEKLEVICGSTWYTEKGAIINLRVRESETGRIVKEEDNWRQLKSNVAIRWAYLNFKKTEEEKGVKKYTAEWFVDGKLVPSRTTNFSVDYGN